MDSSHPRPAGRRGRRLIGVFSALTLLAGLSLAPATAEPVPSPAPAPAAPLDQSALLGRVVPGLVDINTTLGYQGAEGTGAGIVLDPNGDVLTNLSLIHI